MANKRVIDLAELSQTVQEGQYILVDSSGGTGKMDLKRIVDESRTFDPEGSYPDLYAGNLITDKHQTDTTPYLFRPSASVGERAYETIVGASVGWNQLCNGSSVTVPNGHKYYMLKAGTASIGASTGIAITGLTSGTDMVVDLTAELGSTIADHIYTLESATAGSGIAKLREWGFCNGYAEYDAGSIKSVEVTDKVVRGFNAWDEEIESGIINPTTGEAQANSNVIRAKNYINCLPNTTYYVKSPSPMNICFYDANKSFISGLNGATSNVERTTPVNCYYIRFSIGSVYGTTYNHDICINLSSSRNGEYEPYHSQSYPLGSDKLRGIFKLDANNNLYADGDVKSADGTIIRKYGIVTLDGSEAWSADSNGKFYHQLNDMSKKVDYRLSMICDSMTVFANSYGQDFTDATIGITGFHDSTGRYPNQNWIYAKANGLTVVADFKAWLASHPLTVVYELATPTTEQSTPFTSPQTVYPDGTEEFITETPVPVGHSTDYPYSIKALAEELIDIPDVPSANGTYVLKATRSASGISYAWVTA